MGGVLIACALLGVYTWLCHRAQRRFNTAMMKRLEEQERVLRVVVQRDALTPTLRRLSQALEQLDPR